MPTDAPTPSVLWQQGSGADARPAPACLADLHLDQVFAAIADGRDAADLAPIFRAPLRDVADVAHRHDVFRDLADADLRGRVEAFAGAMRHLRVLRRRAEAVRNPRQAQRLRLDAAAAYVAAVRALAHALRRPLRSQGLRAVAAHLDALVATASFRALEADVERLERDLGAVTYRLTLLEDRVHVERTDVQEDYGAAVERTFRPFRRREAPERPAERDDRTDLNVVEAAILERVALLHPEPFAALAAFAARHDAALDPVVARFEREAGFYLAYLAFAARFEVAGLAFALPEVAVDEKRLDVAGGFDLALAHRLLEEGGEVVVNDARLEGAERILVVTGANQGGKSTFARMLGQIHYLAALGCPVPARRARLTLVDGVHTHFDRAEDLRTLQGKLQEELGRLRALLELATPRSIVVMNEPFSSTSTDDALELGRGTLRRLLDLDALGVYVTFVDELASFDPRVASVTATVRPDEGARRTFEIVRRPADGRAHAVAIARAYGLTFEQLRGRLGS